MMVEMKRKHIAHYTWLVFFSYGILLLFASLYWIFAGMPFDRLTYEKIINTSWTDFIAGSSPHTIKLISALVRELGGNIGIVASILIMAISFFSYRKGEKWAWYSLWVVPAHVLFDAITLTYHGALTYSFLVISISSLLGVGSPEG
jgi:hypothetical protein